MEPAATSCQLKREEDLKREDFDNHKAWIRHQNKMRQRKHRESKKRKASNNNAELELIKPAISSTTSSSAGNKVVIAPGSPIVPESVTHPIRAIPKATSSPKTPSSSMPASPSSATITTTATSTSNVSPKKPKILLGITGSVAAVKGPELAHRLCVEYNADVRVVLTQGGKHFWDRGEEYNQQSWREMRSRVVDVRNFEEDTKNGRIILHETDEEWRSWDRLGDPVLHISLRDWADVAIIAPLSAHTLAKLSNGLCDDTLSSCMRAWDFGHGSRPGKPVILAPAMNTAMWEHPLTRKQLDIVSGFWEGKPGGTVVPPMEKVLACGEVGVGAMAEIADILKVIGSLWKA